MLPYIAAVVDETGKVAALGGVYDGVVVNTEHVAATDALFFIALLPHVSNHLQKQIITCYFDPLAMYLTSCRQINNFAFKLKMEAPDCLSHQKCNFKHIKYHPRKKKV